MKRSVCVAALLALTMAAAADRSALAQGGMFARAGYAKQPKSQSMWVAQATPGRAMPGQAMPSARQPEMLPSPPGAPDPFQDDTYYATDHGNQGLEYGGIPGDPEWGDYPYDGAPYDCCETGDAPWWDGWTDGYSARGAAPTRWFFVGDYLYVRASFSEATSYVTQDLSQPTVEIDTYHELDFEYDSSYRFGGGWKLNGCDEQVRFLYTRMNSYATDLAPDDGQIPYPVVTPSGGATVIHARVDAESWDLEYARTIPLGGRNGGCGDGCGDVCEPCCPAWDVTWSGGIRFAEADWRRDYLVLDDDTELVDRADTVMNFSGTGLRAGLQGRRYFGQQGWFSLFVNGNLSVLLGHVNVASTLVTDVDTIDQAVVFQSTNNRNVIPVTEVEAGLTAQLASCSIFSAGYLFSAWHDLGFRDQFNGYTNPNIAVLETDYDDANILGFDGFFARLEFVY